MNTFNVHADMNIEDDEEEFGDTEGRPLVGWFLMAVALVAMAFLIGAGPEASAHAVNPPAVVQIAAQATVPSAPASADAADALAFGG
jgi:hypothetical protein